MTALSTLSFALVINLLLLFVSHCHRPA